jgi:NAD(P)-dependent dehydrogenase (short-subunit alcohol dehydrogenase family)
MALLSGKRALIIGAGSGIGAACARRFAAEGARVVCADLRADAAAATARQIRQTGAEAHAGAARVDIADPEAVAACTDAAAWDLGGLDVAVNTPFGSLSLQLDGLAAAQWRREWEVLASGTLYTFQAALPHLRAAGGGVLLSTTASLFGDYGAFTHPALFPAYSAAKAAQEMLIKVMATLHSREGIRVCGVQPGFTRTQGAIAGLQGFGVAFEDFEAQAGAGMPMGVGDPDAVAEGFVFLASDYASYINGYTLAVDGGSYAGRFGRMLA